MGQEGIGCWFECLFSVDQVREFGVVMVTVGACCFGAMALIVGVLVFRCVPLKK